MNNIYKKLENLLLKEYWTKEDCDWLNEYLQKDDLSVLQTIARKQFDDDMDAAEKFIEEKLSDKMLATIHAKINIKKKRKKIYNITVAAASILLLLTVGLTYFNSIRADKNLVSYIEISTEPGQTKEVQLADGTLVWLSPASSLKYPDKFTGEQRAVELSGEAFFNVSQDAKKPFIVTTQFLKIKVLGTSFDINTYENRAYATVTVATGEVAVKKINGSASDRNKTMKLLPDQRAIFTARDGSLIKGRFPNAEKILYGRRNGVLQYNGANLQMVVEDLSVQYGINIKLGEALRDDTYYGSFNVKQNSRSASLKLLCLALHVKPVQAGGYYVIGE